MYACSCGMEVEVVLSIYVLYLLNLVEVRTSGVTDADKFNVHEKNSKHK